ncbi:MAG: hypothetical protein AAGH17_10700, partial [Pseudomonadota bacterium]
GNGSDCRLSRITTNLGEAPHLRGLFRCRLFVWRGNAGQGYRPDRCKDASHKPTAPSTCDWVT